jgi:MGT family glycosyltransferase
MASIVAFTHSFSGHLFPFLPLCKELQRRGHRVTLAICSERDVPPEFYGIQVTRVSWSPPDESTWLGKKKPRLSLVSTTEYFAGYGESVANGLDRVLSIEDPDFVLVDPKMWGGMIAAEAFGRPWATIAHNPLLMRGLGVDPRGPGLPPPKTVMARARHKIFEFAMHAETVGHLGVLNAARTRRSLAPLARLTDLYGLPPLILATTCEPFEYPRTDWPSALCFVGPMIFDPTESATFETDVADPRPLVLLAGSTVAAQGAQASWADIVLQALADEPYRLVATLPTELVHTSVTGAVRKENTPLPHSAILPHAACVVCHGGQGIVQKALWYGVPVVAIPFGYDRFEVARRVEVAGAGVMLPFDRLTVQTLRNAVRVALGRKEGAENVGRQFRKAGGSQLAADLVERLLAAKRTADPVIV